MRFKNMKVICIDSSNKPDRIPDNEWIVEYTVYTVIETVRMSLQNNKIGYLLKEVQLSENSFPYEYYAAERFISMGHLASFMFKQEIEKEVELEEFAI